MKKTYYYIYETTNLINGKTYIGQHITENLDDGYLGSGRALLRAIKKYGKINFRKEILLFAANLTALNFMEKCLVTLDYIEDHANYNMREGGGSRGSPSQLTRLKLSISNRASSKLKGVRISEERRLKMIGRGLGKKDSPETLRKKSLAQRGLKKPRSEQNLEKWRKIKKEHGKCWDLSPETRVKMSGKTPSQDTIRKRSEALRMKISPLQKEKILSLLVAGTSQRKIAQLLNFKSRTPIARIAKELREKERTDINQYISD